MSQQQSINPNLPTILMMSDCPLLKTGQAVVVKEVATGLQKTGKYNIVVAAWGYNGYPHDLPFIMLPASARDFGKTGHPESGVPGIEQIISFVKPQILWTIGDIWMIDYITQLPNRKDFKWVAYTPIDGEPIPRYWEPWFKNPDRLVMETQYGYDQVKAFSPEVDHRWVYHGCNPKIYYPLPATVKSNIRKNITYLKPISETNLNLTQGLSDSDFVVGVIARNQPRKNYDRNMRGFALFAKDKPNAKLWIHAAPIDQGYNLVQLAYYLGIQDKVVFTPKNSIVNGLSEEEMNVMMNVFDVHSLPTQGEGFGIPIIETMAAGVPQVLTDYTSHVEFSKTAGIMIKCDPHDDFLMGMPHPVERAIPKPTRIAEALEKMYTDVDFRKQCSINARAVAENISWAASIPKWQGILDEVLAPKPAPTQQTTTIELIKF